MLFKFIKNTVLVGVIVSMLGIGSTFSDSFTDLSIGVSPLMVSGAKADTAVSRFLSYNSHTFLVNSHGGEAYSMLEMSNLINEMKANGTKVTTKITTAAASAGAIIFMEGDERIISKRAIILFHGAHFGNYTFTEPNLKRALDFIESGKLDLLIAGGNVTNIDDVYALDTIQAIMNSSGTSISGIKHTIKTLHESLSITNAQMVKLVTKKYNAIHNTTYSEADIRKVLFADFKEDIILTGEQAFEYGIATKLVD